MRQYCFQINISDVNIKAPVQCRSVRTSLLEIETVKVKLIFCVLQKSRSATASIIYFFYTVVTVHLYGICRCSVNIITAATIPYTFILKTKFSNRCNSCPGCPNNTKFCSQTDLKHEDFNSKLYFCRICG